MKKLKRDKKRLQLSRQKVKELTTEKLQDVDGGHLVTTTCATEYDTPR